MPRHWNGHIYHVYISQSLFVLHDHDFNLRFDVANVGGFWIEGYRIDGECIL